MELQILGAEEWKEEVCELLVEDAYFGPLVNVLREEANPTEEAENWESQRSKEIPHRNNMVQVRLFGLDCGLHFAGILGHSASRWTCGATSCQNIMTLRLVAHTKGLKQQWLPFDHDSIGLIQLRTYWHGFVVVMFATVSSMSTNSRMARCNC